MYVLCGIKVNSFYGLVERLCGFAGIPYRKSIFSKKMYGNIALTFLVAYKEKLNVSYRRFTEICSENAVARMLCIKRVPHFTTLQKFVQRTNKIVFEKLILACKKLLKLKNITASIDGTGFSNSNPSHYYQKRIDGKTVKNYTKTVFTSDTKTKLILQVKTFSDHTHESTAFKPMIKQLASCLKTVLADKGYDSMSNRKACWENKIAVHIPFKQHKKDRFDKSHYSAERRRALKLFNKKIYDKRALAESVNSAIKQTLGGFVRARTASNQQKNVIIKAIAYNIEHIGRTIKIQLIITCQGFLQNLTPSKV